jgi:hypothetical protein
MDGLAWLVLVYRVPSEPASRRVAVWRDLKRLGALYLQQCVCILPQLGQVPDDLTRVTTRITSLGGEHTLFEVPRLRPDDQQRIIQAFRDLRNKEYAEIIEECETKFVKEVEFEHFRENYSFEEAEEIAQDLEKIRRWFDGIRARDWFGAERSAEVATWLERCQELLAGFEEAVYQRSGGDDAAGATVAPSRLVLREFRPGRATATADAADPAIGDPSPPGASQRHDQAE